VNQPGAAEGEGHRHQTYHPFGLANYAVTYTGYQVLQNSLQWTRP
jgi:hypothetical protein